MRSGILLDLFSSLSLFLKCLAHILVERMHDNGPYWLAWDGGSRERFWKFGQKWEILLCMGAFKKDVKTRFQILL